MKMRVYHEHATALPITRRVLPMKRARLQTCVSLDTPLKTEKKEIGVFATFQNSESLCCVFYDKKYVNCWLLHFAYAYLYMGTLALSYFPRCSVYLSHNLNSDYHTTTLGRLLLLCAATNVFKFRRGIPPVARKRYIKPEKIFTQTSPRFVQLAF